MRKARKLGSMAGGALFTLLLTAGSALAAPNYPPPNPPKGTDITRNGPDAVAQEVAFTGADVTLLIAVAAVLVAVGLGALMLGRRRAVRVTG